MTFTPAELAAQDEAFRRHREGRCPGYGECGFCFDLELSDVPEHQAELRRIRAIKAQRSQQDRERSKRGRKAKKRPPEPKPLPEPGTYLVPPPKVQKLLERQKEADARKRRRARGGKW